ncbi:MAG: hypothetical protein QM677_03875 [Microbacterium sp.]
MVTLLLDSTQLGVVLSPAERVLSHRSDPVRIERDLIRKVQLTDDAWTWLRGVPSPGTLLRGTVAMGTWRSAGGDDFVVVRRRRAAVVIDLDETAEFARLVLTTRYGLELVQALRLDAGGPPTEVTEIVAASGDEQAPAEPPASKRRSSRRAPKAKPATA